MTNLKTKHDIEEAFHDAWAKGISMDSLLVRESFEADTAVENMAALKNFGDLQGRKILDLGCGAGEAAVYFALQGGDVFAVDISSEMLRRAGELSERYRVGLKLSKMAAESLKFESGLFDFIFGNGALHHIDIRLAIPEISRILKKGGKAIFIEPLGYNPVIKIYRKMAQEVRTETEAPFRYHHLDYMKGYFSKVRHENFWLLSLIIFVYMYLIERVHPARDRYWKRIIREHKRYGRVFKFLNRIDRLILRILPVMDRFCWNTMIILEK